MREQKKDIALIISAILLVLSVMNIHVNGICKGCSIIDRLTYSFYHANIVHACINIYVYLGMVFLLGSSMLDMVVAYIICVCVPPLMLTHTTTIGLSGFVYALIGLKTFYVTNPIKYTLSVIIPLIFTSFFPYVAFGVHIWCYAVGVICSIIILCAKKLRR